MDAMQKSSAAVSSRPSQEKDFPYFRRLFNSIVVALLAASFIPLLVIGGGMYYHTVSILEQKTLAALDAEISEHREAIDQFLTERTIDLKNLSGILGFDYLTVPGNLKKMFDTLQQQLPCFTDIGVIDDQGRHRAYVGPYDLLSKNYKETPWFKAIAQKDFTISDVFLGFRNDPHFIIAVKQVTSEGFWILRATVDTAYFEGLVAEILSKRDGDAYIVNRDGIFQTTPRWGGKIMGQSDVKSIEPLQGVRLEERGGQDRHDGLAREECPGSAWRSSSATTFTALFEMSEPSASSSLSSGPCSSCSRSFSRPTISFPDLKPSAGTSVFWITSSSTRTGWPPP